MGIFIAYTEVLGIINGKNNLESEIVKIEKKYSSENPEDLRNNPIVRAYRDFYWKIGIDPTKTRPSGEALRRRINRNGKLPRLNDIVDAGNIASADTLVPIGIYDMSKIRGNISLIISSGNEIFYGIGKKDPEKLDKDIPILVDDEGKVMHIYPHRDSILTSVDLNTRDVLIIGAGVPNVDKNLVTYAVNLTCNLLSKLGGKIANEVVLV
jgi:DNA/RNA-binding domain of Phe-tRNA-synthetase-like protein